MGKKVTRTKENSVFINKTVPMDPGMIEAVHEIMIASLKKENRQVSFGEAARRLIVKGLEKTSKIG